MLKSVIIYDEEIPVKKIIRLTMEWEGVTIVFRGKHWHEEITGKAPFQSVRFVDDSEEEKLSPVEIMKQAFKDAIRDNQIDATLTIDGVKFGKLIVKEQIDEKESPIETTKREMNKVLKDIAEKEVVITLPEDLKRLCQEIFKDNERKGRAFGKERGE